ncbi:hypothetical protein MAR_037259, partial [Mya arenaria]
MARGVNYQDGEDVISKARDIIVSLGTDVAESVYVVNATRFRAHYNGKPGLIKVVLRKREVKVAILRNKMKLKDSDHYKQVYIKSCKSHAERLIELNARAILQQLPQGHDLRVDANGRIRRGNRQEHQQQQGIIRQHDGPRPNGTLKLAHINVCGWTEGNHLLREELIRCLNADIKTVIETHLSGNNVRNCEGYRWFGYNKIEIYRRAPKPSGGVGILIKQCVADAYEVCKVDKVYEGILALKITHRETESDLVIFSCYLPPENSVWGRDGQSFFAHLLSLIYTHGDCDYMFIGADFNARIDRHDLHGLIGVRSRLPDHSALLAEIDLGFCETDYSMHGSSNSENQPRFNPKRIPNDFMDSDMAKRAIVNMITRIERCRETQNEIDDIYEYLCEVILKEMSDNIPKSHTSRRTQKRQNHTKPFWNDELQSLWNILCRKEKDFLR